MKDLGLDAMVAFSKENVAYGAGYVVPSQALDIRDRCFSVVVAADGNASMLLTENELPDARTRGTIPNLFGYKEFDDDPMVVLTEIVTNMGLGKGRIAVELDALAADRWERLKALLSGAEVVHGAEAFSRARMLKVPEEIEAMRAVCMIAEQAQAAAHQGIPRGGTERDVYRKIVGAALEHGADSVVMVQVAADERSMLSNPTPSDRELQVGSIVKVDTFIEKSAYLSDTGRSFAVVSATPRQRDVWKRMQEVLSSLEEAIDPGVSTRFIWELFLREFERRNLKPAMRFVGHGLGMSLHEPPYINARSTATIEANMVLAIEPVAVIDGVGLHLEDNLVVTDQGVDILTTRFDQELITVDFV